MIEDVEVVVEVEDVDKVEENGDDADDAAAQIKDLMYGAKPDDIEDMKNLVSRAKTAGLSPEQAMAAARSSCSTVRHGTTTWSM